MIRTPLLLHEPTSAREAVDVLAEHGEDAAVLGGGTWLLPQLGRGERTVSHVISLRGLALESVSESADGFTIAATATYEDLLADTRLGSRLPVLRDVVAGITGGVGLRNVATAVGAACYANPASDVPGVLVGLDAVIHVAGPDGERDIPAPDFFVGPFKTGLRANEIALSASLPVNGRRAAYSKVKTSAGGWPVATAVAWIDDAARRAGIVVGAVQAVPLVLDVGDLVAGAGLRADELADRVGANVTEPWSDLLGDADYRRRIAGPVARRAAEKLELTA